VELGLSVAEELPSQLETTVIEKLPVELRLPTAEKYPLEMELSSTEKLALKLRLPVGAIGAVGMGLSVAKSSSLTGRFFVIYINSVAKKA
jgi:hypothetical protein